MWRFIFLAALAACSPADQEAGRLVAAIEVPLSDRRDRNDLVAILRQNAAASGLHVDDVSAEWREFEQHARQIAPAEQVTFNVGVWYGTDDDELVVLADDRFHQGRAWVSFLRGVKPDRFKSYRESTMKAVRARWPEARIIPILPWGGLPHARDLVLTPTGYKISRSAAADYTLSPSLPIFAPE